MVVFSIFWPLKMTYFAIFQKNLNQILASIFAIFQMDIACINITIDNYVLKIQKIYQHNYVMQ